MTEVTFSYLKNNPIFKNEYPLAHKISQLYLISDWRDVLINARSLLESTVKVIFNLENLNQYYQTQTEERRTLRNDIFYLQQEVDYPQSIFNLMNEIRRIGNEAIHDSNFKTSKNQAWHIICNLNDLFVFLINSYAQEKPLYYLRPDITLEAAEHPDQYGQRKIKGINHTAPENPNVVQAKQLLDQKKPHFRKLRKFLKRKKC